mmetsp:Transcript_12566/g.29127  ORF Transcript_12566/g.29127 Transcript_12566/m.29127 type:complete len:135 (+) Transcript_12566:217-621(+)
MMAAMRSTGRIPFLQCTCLGSISLKISLLICLLTYFFSLYSAQFLRERKDSSPEWTRNVPLIAKRLELSLYRTSQSFEEYIDDSTLKNRLKKMAAKTLHLKRARDAAAAASIRRAKTQKQKNTHKESGSVQKLA